MAAVMPATKPWTPAAPVAHTAQNRGPVRARVPRLRMTGWALLFLAGFASTATFAQGPTSCMPELITLAADDPRLSFSGRWAVGPGGARRVAWAGASVTLRFRGEGVAVDLDPGNQAEQFRIAVDGEAHDEVLVAAPGPARYRLADRLDPARPHTVQLMKETYVSDQTILFGFELDGCVVLEPPPVPPRRIMFFGDSNMDGTSLYDEKDGGDSGAWFAYPAAVGRMLDAQISVQAFGGATLTGDGDNNVLSFITAQRRDRPDPEYRDGFRPDVIVVNAGANDLFDIPEGQRVGELRRRYRAVVARLRAVYGDQPHIMLYNAYGWHLDEPANITPDVVEAIGGNLSAVLYPWIWEQFHGAMAEHGGQARFLAEAIAERVPGFTVVRPLDFIDGWGRDFDVANGGFEAIARSGFNAFGWRYADDGVERVRDPAGAFEGVHYIRLEAGESVHQGTDATGDFLPGPTASGQRYELTARVRAVGGTATARLAADFEGQAMYGRSDGRSKSFHVGPEWQPIRFVFTAPAGAWKTFVILAADAGTVDFDAVRMRDPDR